MADMPEKAKQAYEDYKNGLKYQEIADKYGVSVSTVKSWAARHWKPLESENKKGKGRNPKKKKVATKPKEKSQPEKKKRGGQPGNQNSVGHVPSNPFPERNQAALRHGAYAKYASELLEGAELEIFQDIGSVSLHGELMQNYTSLELQEYRVMVYIGKLKLLQNEKKTGMITVEAQTEQELQSFGQFQNKNILTRDGNPTMETRDEATDLEDDPDGYDEYGEPVKKWHSRYGMIAFAEDDTVKKSNSAKQVLIEDRIASAEALLTKIRAQKLKVLSMLAKMDFDASKFALDMQKHTFDREKYEHQLELENGAGKNDIAADWVDAVLEADELEAADDG